jgi:hypothetical protein
MSALFSLSLSRSVGCAVKLVWWLFLLFFSSSRVFLKNKLISHRGKKNNQMLLSYLNGFWRHTNK